MRLLTQNKFFRLFQKHPDFACLTLGDLLSSIGISFTAIATYSLLESIKASPLVFSVAFILETAPGALAAWAADKYFKQVNLGKALICSEFIGGALMILPILGILHGSLALLLVAGVIGSATVGFMVPYQRTHMRRILKDDEVSVATFLSTYTFAITFILGTVAGTVILNKAGAFNFYLIDSLTYFASCLLTILAMRLRRKNFSPQNEVIVKSSWKSLFNGMNPTQKKAIFLTSLLILNCSPSAAILPAIASNHSAQWQQWGIFVSLAMTLIILKTVGQILGPIVVDKFDITKVIEKKWVVPVCLLIYQSIYCAIFLSQNILWVIPLVILAHVASNIVFMLGYYSMLRYFNEDEIGSYSSFQHQLSILILVVSCLWSGWVATEFGVLSVAGITLIIGVLTSLAYLKFESNKELCHVAA